MSTITHREDWDLWQVSHTSPDGQATGGYFKTRAEAEAFLRNAVETLKREQAGSIRITNLNPKPPEPDGRYDLLMGDDDWL